MNTHKACLGLTLLLIALGCVRIVLTYPHLTHTVDEPAHLAAGLELLSSGTYTYEYQHPPLTRVVAAMGPFLTGLRSQGHTSMWEEGAALLFAGDYRQTLSLARSGNLLFFVAACLAVYMTAAWLFQPATGLLAVLVFSMTPTVLAHAGVATTDMGLTATFALAVLAFARWLQRPAMGRALLFTLAAALCLLTKFSALLFLPVACLAMLPPALAARRDLPALRSLRLWPVTLKTLGLLGLFLLTLWAGYGFSVGRLVSDPDSPLLHVVSDALFLPFEDMRSLLSREVYPLSELVKGVVEVASHNTEGHRAYLLGRVSDTGWWYYYPVALALKLPLVVSGLWVLGAGWLVMGWRRHGIHVPALAVLTVPLAVLLAAMLVSNINIGVRHILAVLPFVAVACGHALQRMLANKGAVMLLGVLAAAMVCLTSLLAHPDYLSFFNLLARDKPYRYLVDSDLDWGQNLGAVAGRLRELEAQEIHLAFLSSPELSPRTRPLMRPRMQAALGLPDLTDITMPADLPGEIRGWVAIDATLLLTRERFGWLRDRKPVEVVKDSFFLYHFDRPVRTGDDRVGVPWPDD